MSAIKQLNERDARLLLAVSDKFQPADSQEEAIASKFCSLGLMDGFSWTKVLKGLDIDIAIVSGFVMSFLALQFARQWDKYGEIFGQSVRVANFESIYDMCSWFIIFGLAIWIIFIFRKITNSAKFYLLTPLGQSVRASALRYTQRASSKNTEPAGDDAARSARKPSKAQGKSSGRRDE